MKKMTSAVANKLLKQLDEDKAYYLSKEENSCMYVAAEGEAPVIPEFDYAENAAVIAALDEEIQIIKHAINLANVTSRIQVVVKENCKEPESENARYLKTVLDRLMEVSAKTSAEKNTEETTETSVVESNDSGKSEITDERTGKMTGSRTGEPSDNCDRVVVREYSVDTILVRMAQLNRRKDVLDNMRKQLPKVRQNSYSYSSRSNSVPEYRYINYDLALVKAEYERISSEIMALQIALDKYNQTYEFEVAI